MDLSGNMVRQVEVDMPVEDESSHIANIGRVSGYERQQGFY
jgi:capping protein beta